MRGGNVARGGVRVRRAVARGSNRRVIERGDQDDDDEDSDGPRAGSCEFCL